MKKTISLVLMLFVALTSFAQQTDMSAYQPKLKIGEKAPDFALPVYNSEKKIALSDYAGKYVMLDFWATWCGPCKKIAPYIEELASNYEGQAVVGKVDIEENDDLVEKFGIRNIPTVIYIKNGEVVDKNVGAAAKAVYEDKLKAIL